ncbi:Leucine-, isoleucine-, valine-, threonine-, and alanine-binding protein [archaeon HR01]|nr:Leucine-, isoleucine-, valine-, threonine-, and alanine-binding protein [archaeon HR01]
MEEKKREAATANRITRRKAISSAVAAGAVVGVGIVAGLGGYFAGAASGGRAETITQKETVTVGGQTVTVGGQTVTVTNTVTQPTTVTATVTGTTGPAKPVVIGYTLPKTGGFAANGVIHDIADEIAIRRINETGGFLGRPVERLVYDDRSDISQIPPLYERLITQDQVDLIVGPYATPFIAAAMPVAEKYRKVYIFDSYTLPKQATYEFAFSSWATGYNTDIEWPTLLFEALQNSAGKLPKSLVVVHNTHPGATFVASGVPKVADSFGIEVLDVIRYELGTTDFLPIATRLKELKPEFVFQGGLVLDESNLKKALDKAGFIPYGHSSLWPAVGAVLGLGPLGEGLISQSVFERHIPFTQDAEARYFVRNYEKRAQEAGLAYWKADTQSGTSYAMFQILREGVRGSGSLNDEDIGNWLKRNTVDTIFGELRFDGPNNYGPMKTWIAQIQNGEQIVVWPPDYAKPGSKLLYPSPLAKGY